VIVNCPQCRKPISNKVPVCPHCSLERSEISDEQISEMERRRLRDRIYRLKMANYAAITVLLTAAGWYFYETAKMNASPSFGPLILTGIGAVFYVILRGLLFQSKRQLKQLRRR